MAADHGIIFDVFILLNNCAVETHGLFGRGRLQYLGSLFDVLGEQGLVRSVPLEGRDEDGIVVDVSFLTIELFDLSEDLLVKVLDQVWVLLVLRLDLVKHDLFKLPLLLVLIFIDNFISLVLIQLSHSFHHPDLVKGLSGGVFRCLPEKLFDVKLSSFLFDGLKPPRFTSVFEF